MSQFAASASKLRRPASLISRGAGWGRRPRRADHHPAEARGSMTSCPPHPPPPRRHLVRRRPPPRRTALRRRRRAVERKLQQSPSRSGMLPPAMWRMCSNVLRWRLYRCVEWKYIHLTTKMGTSLHFILTMFRNLYTCSTRRVSRDRDNDARVTLRPTRGPSSVG